MTSSSADIEAPATPPPTSTSAPLARDRIPETIEPSEPFADKVAVLATITPILLEVFSVVDDVFTESDALSPEKRQVGLSRIYRSWKSAKAQLDPEATT